MKPILVLAVSLPLTAQWLHQPTVGIPRTPDGKPNLKAPAPRTAGNKPDLSGLWQKRPGKYGNDIAADLTRGDVQPWAEALYQKHKEDLGKDSMSMLCVPWGPRFSTSFLSKIVQTPGSILILQDDLSYRQIFMDGRELPKDPSPSFMGYSAGRWEGDALVVESIGFNDRTWLDGGGHPHTEALHLTERFRRTDFGHMSVELTLDDPKAYAKPWTEVRITQTADGLFFESEGIGKIALNALSRTAFAGGRIEFMLSTDGTATRFNWDRPSGALEGVRAK